MNVGARIRDFLRAYPARNILAVALLATTTVFVLVTWKSLTAETPIPALQDGEVVASTPGMSAAKADYWVQERLNPTGESAGKQNVTLAFRISEPQLADFNVVFAFVGDLAKLDLQCTPDPNRAILDFKLRDLKPELQVGAAMGSITQTRDPLDTAPVVDTNVQTALTDIGDQPARVIAVHAIATDKGVQNATYGAEGTFTCQVHNGKYTVEHSGVFEPNWMEVVAPRVVSVAPNSTTTLATHHSVTAYVQGNYIAERSLFEPVKSADGSLQWSLNTTGSQSAAGLSVQSGSAVAATLEDPKAGWRRDVLLLVLGALVAMTAAAIVETLVRPFDD